jgi:hypothetical protein
LAATSSSERTRVATAPVVGETLGSRSTYRLIAQPFSARNAASSRRPSRLTVIVVIFDLSARPCRILSLCRQASPQ